MKTNIIKRERAKGFLGDLLDNMDKRTLSRAEKRMEITIKKKRIMIKLEFTGTLTAINVIAFKNKKGEDGKRNEYLFKVTDNNYDDMIAVGAIDEEKFSFLKVGDVCKVKGFIRSREYKEKWYTSVTLSYVERDKKDSNEKDVVKPDGLPF